MHTRIFKCRICGGDTLEPILDLGVQALTGVFPREDTKVASGPLQLLKCATCDLVQLAHNYELSALYGENYGYRSGLNPSMVRHLQTKVRGIQELVKVGAGDLIVDIGSNDGTLLRSYGDVGAERVGIDPSGAKFKKYYPTDVRLLPSFFSGALLNNAYPGRKARVITSIAMFYDLEDPQAFVNEVAAALHPEGVWVFEQSYLPAMLAADAYDTVCHEHLEYYAMKQIEMMLTKAGLKIVDLEFNTVNGGSFSVSAAHATSSLPSAQERVTEVLQQETRDGIYNLDTYGRFAARVQGHKSALVQLLGELRSAGKRVLGYGASTKGNVIIQYCDIGPTEIPFIAEVNEDKFGAFTPGSRIPIIAEAEARAMRPDFLIVFPWHFRDFIIEKEQPFLRAGGSLIFPLPELQIVSSSGIHKLPST
jgi:C-methyltransferase C-terminal domain/Putative zinc binding domain/Methyltransferase domain